MDHAELHPLEMDYDALMTDENLRLYVWTSAPARLVEVAPPRVPITEVLTRPTVGAGGPSKGKGKRKAKDALQKKPSVRPPVASRVSLVIADEPEDPEIPSLEMKKKKKKKKGTEGSSQATRPIVELEAEETEAHSVPEATGTVPDITPDVEQPTPHVRAYSSVLLN